MFVLESDTSGTRFNTLSNFPEKTMRKKREYDVAVSFRPSSKQSIALGGFSTSYFRPRRSGTPHYAITLIRLKRITENRVGRDSPRGLQQMRRISSFKLPLSTKEGGKRGSGRAGISNKPLKIRKDERRINTAKGYRIHQ